MLMTTSIPDFQPRPLTWVKRQRVSCRRGSFPSIEGEAYREDERTKPRIRPLTAFNSCRWCNCHRKSAPKAPVAAAMVPRAVLFSCIAVTSRFGRTSAGSPGSRTPCSGFDRHRKAPNSIRIRRTKMQA